MAGGRQRHPDRSAERLGKGTEGVGGDAAEQGSRRRRLPAPGQQRCRRQGGQAEAGERDRVLREVRHGAHQILEQGIEVPGGGGEEAPPGLAVHAEASDRLIQRAHQGCGGPIVERVREVYLCPAPLEPVALQPERAQKG